MKKKTIYILLLVVLLSVSTVIKLYRKETINHEYNIYVVNATLPTLMIGMDLVENKDQNTFLFYAREDTLNTEQLEKYMPNLTLSNYIGSYESIQRNVNNELKEYVKKVLKRDKKAHFNLIVDEYRGWLEFPIFLEQGLTDDQYSVTYYSDGTLSYTVQHEITKENNYDFFKEEKEKYMNLIDEVRNGKYKCDEKCDYLINDKITKSEFLVDYQYDENFILLATLRDNVDYYLQYPELIEFKDEKIKKEMSKANFKDININDKFNELSDEEKSMLFKIINFDKETFDTNYFNDKDGKYLIITGANPFYGKYNEETFNRLIKEVVDKYKDKYSILYKPHPAALPNKDQEQFLTKNNIKILPGKMPMEAISFVYNDLALGGFPSSLYMSAESENILFFFEENKNNLVTPLNILYDDLFKNAEMMS